MFKDLTFLFVYEIFSSFTKMREGFLGQQIFILYFGTKKLQAKYGSPPPKEKRKKENPFYFLNENVNLINWVTNS
jgi:hypothetical protein